MKTFVRRGGLGLLILDFVVPVESHAPSDSAVISIAESSIITKRLREYNNSEIKLEMLVN